MRLEADLGTGVRHSMREAIAWRLVSEWFRRHPRDLWLRRLSWPGEGDTLRVFVASEPYLGHHADIPVDGPDTVRFFASQWQFEMPDLVRTALEHEREDEMVERLCTDLQLTCHHPPLPAATRRTLTYRVIAGLMAFTALEGDEWSCASVVGGATPSDLTLREDLLAAFPQLRLRPPEHAYPPEALEEDALGHWVITRGGDPMVALSDGAVAHLRSGESLDLHALYRETRRPGAAGRVGPLVAAAVGSDFLP